MCPVNTRVWPVMHVSAVSDLYACVCACVCFSLALSLSLPPSLSLSRSLCVCMCAPLSLSVCVQGGQQSLIDRITSTCKTYLSVPEHTTARVLPLLAAAHSLSIFLHLSPHFLSLFLTTNYTTFVSLSISLCVLIWNRVWLSPSLHRTRPKRVKLPRCFSRARSPGLISQTLSW